MARIADYLKNFYAKDQSSWRSWLAENHDTSPGIWLIYDKQKDGQQTLPYSAIVDEALCFGWVDSLPRKLSESQSMLLITPRNSRSPWSAINKAKVERLISEGKMTPAGLEKITQAKQDGSWDILNEVEQLIMPADLEEVLLQNDVANTYFDAFPASAKKGIYQWIISAKTPSTRQKRIQQTVSLAEQNIRANQWKPKKT